MSVNNREKIKEMLVSRNVLGDQHPATPTREVLRQSRKNISFRQVWCEHYIKKSYRLGTAQEEVEGK